MVILKSRGDLFIYLPVLQCFMYLYPEILYPDCYLTLFVFICCGVLYYVKVYFGQINEGKRILGGIKQLCIRRFSESFHIFATDKGLNPDLLLTDIIDESVFA